MIRGASRMAEFQNPDHWDTAARHYEKTAHPFTARYAEAALARVTLTSDSRVLDVAAGTGALALLAARTGAQVLRSEEHTSELQSLMRISYAVFCLKNKKTTHR